MTAAMLLPIIKTGTSEVIKNFTTTKKNNDKLTVKKLIYRNDGKTPDKIIEYNPATGQKIKIINLDYFNSQKIKSIEEYSNDIKVKYIRFSIYKTVTEYDKLTGKKFKSTNYDPKNDSKKISVYDYDIDTENLIRITVYRSDGKTVSFVKEISPDTGRVKRCINYKRDSSAISSISKFDLIGDTTVKTTFYYSTPLYLTTPEMLEKKLTEDSINRKILTEFDKNKVDKLIGNLYKNKPNITSIAIS